MLCRHRNTRLRCLVARCGRRLHGDHRRIDAHHRVTRHRTGAETGREDAHRLGDETVPHGGGEDAGDDMADSLRRLLIGRQSPTTYFRNVF